MSGAAWWAVLLAALLGIIGLELRPEREDESSMVPVASRAITAPAIAAAGGTVPPADIQLILTRPLFSPDRRPAAAAVTAAGPQTLPRLMGIIVEPGRRAALFAGAGGGRPLVLEERGGVAGFTVQRIEPAGVTLLGPGGTRLVQPSFDPKAPTPGPAAGAPAGAVPPDLGALTGIPGLPPLPGLPARPPGAGPIPGAVPPAPPAGGAPSFPVPR